MALPIWCLSTATVQGVCCVFYFFHLYFVDFGDENDFSISPNLHRRGGFGLAMGWFLWSKYLTKELNEVVSDKKGWAWLFFLSIVTHPILDCFTAFGTQILLPFTNLRVSWDNISVVDPAYTIPLFLGVLVASFISRNSKKRQIANWVGIAISSAYMAFTFYHKTQFNKILERSLANEGIEYNRYMSGPSILQNFLWLGVVETDSAFYHGYYSFFDKEPIIKKFNVLAKGHELIAPYKDHKDIKTLEWFTKNYYNIIVRKDGRLQFNDLRYGSFQGDIKNEKDYVFKFILTETKEGLEVSDSDEGREMNKEILNRYFDRVFGKQE